MTKKRYVSSEEIHKVFHAPTKKKQKLPSWQLLSAAILVVVGFYVLVNAPAVSQQLDYWWNNEIKTDKRAELAVNVPSSSQSSLPTNTPVNSPTSVPAMPVTTSLDPAKLTNNSIYIPKTKTKAPIIWDVSGGKDLNSDLLKALEKGVVRYPQTALPNQSGNLFLTGHSSNYWWEKGKYKTVFALIGRLVVGDIIYVKYDNQLYTYKVTGQKVVKPSNTSVLKPTSTPTLSLMTCTPTGTSLLRRIVTARLVSPTTNLLPQPSNPIATDLGAVR